MDINATILRMVEQRYPLDEIAKECQLNQSEIIEILRNSNRSTYQQLIQGFNEWD